MFDFLDYLNSIILGDDGSSQTTALGVMHDFAQDQGFNLTDEQIVHSVQEASDFFNMDCPAIVREGWTTGVSVQMASTAADDVLLINRAQMEHMHITDPQAFDLVMTHEGAHRALQCMDTGYTDHQEELCCDTMAGVRAALNSMPEDAINEMKASLENTVASATHPGGLERVQAIDDGYDFATAYMREHNGMAPSFSDCLDHFNSVHNIQEVKGLVTLRPEEAPEAVRSYSAEEIEFRMLKIQNEINDLQNHLQHHNISSNDGGLWRASELAGADAIQERLDAATREYNRWREELPDSDVREYTTNDIDWLAKQVRNSHGMEQAHWLEKLNWAKSHVSGFVDDATLDTDVHRYSTNDVEWLAKQVRNSHGSEQQHWQERLTWAKNHISGYVDDSNEANLDTAIHGYTTHDIEWLAKQVRISHGSEQDHWLSELNWAKNHVSGFADEIPDIENLISGDTSSDDSVHGFINDKGWHLKQAAHEQKEMEYYERQMKNALKNEKIENASAYEYKMKMHQKRMQSHLDDAKRSTKLFASSDPFSSGFDAEHPMPSYDQLRNAGFSDHVANSILNTDQHHTYSQRELHDVLYSNNPLEAYNQMMSAKAQAHFQRTAELERELNRDFGIFVAI